MLQGTVGQWLLNISKWSLKIVLMPLDNLPQMSAFGGKKLQPHSDRAQLPFPLFT